MAEKRKKFGFDKLKNTTSKVKQQQVYIEGNLADATGRPIAKKIGRPTWKDPNETYVRLSVDVPKAVREQLKVLLYTKFKDTYISQDELINVAIMEFLGKHEKK